MVEVWVIVKVVIKIVLLTPDSIVRKIILFPRKNGLSFLLDVSLHICSQLFFNSVEEFLCMTPDLSP